MTAQVFAEQTWWLPCLVIVIAALTESRQVIAWAFGLGVAWLIAVAAMAIMRG